MPRKVVYSSRSWYESEQGQTDIRGTAAAGAADPGRGEGERKPQGREEQQRAVREGRSDSGRSRSRRGRGAAGAAGGEGGGSGEAAHTYEVGASGHVREAHGHMLGPDEEDLIASDDSDKVRLLVVAGCGLAAADQLGVAGGGLPHASWMRTGRL